MDNIGIILPLNRVKKSRFKRLEKLVKYFFKKVNNIYYFSLSKTSKKFYQKLGVKTAVLKYNSIFDNENFLLNKNIKNLVIIRDDTNQNPPFAWKLNNINVFKEIMFSYGGLRLVSGTRGKKGSFFHNLTEEGYVFFPYTFLIKQNVFNDDNSLGFRIKEDFLKYKNRDKNHIVIAIFGGSGAYDLVNITPFSKIIEKKLNKLTDKKITVLNFAISGGIIINEIIAYHLFAYKINPDIVISYNGFNDFIMGQYNDSELLQNQIPYNPIYEEFANKVYNNKNNSTMLIKNNAFIIVDSYLQKLKEFEKLVTNRGKTFISVLQPFINSKQELSKMEKYYKTINRLEQYEQGINNLNIIYNKYLKIKNKTKYFIDIHTYFKQFNHKQTLFADNVHTMPKGSSLIANRLVKYLKEFL